MTAQKDLTPLEYQGALLDAMMAHVPFDGWSQKALFAAGEDLGLSAGFVELAFPRGPVEALCLHLELADLALFDAIQSLDLKSMKIRDKITQAIKMRLVAAAPYREAVKKGMALLLLPQNAVTGSKALWATADTMWRAIGDTSTDHNWYTKRMTLSAVYSAVLLCWLNDESEDYQDSWAFLDRRIEDVMGIEGAKFNLRKVMANAPSLPRFLGRMRYPFDSHG